MIEVYTYTMSQLTAIEKYRKYEKLLHHDPHNATYRRKVNKYKILASKSKSNTKFGGSNKGSNMNTIATSHSNPNNKIPIQTQFGSSTSFASSTSTMSSPILSTSSVSSTSMPMMNMINRSGNSATNTKDILLKKINDMIEYSKNNNMFGGTDPEQYKQEEMTKIQNFKKEADMLDTYNKTIIAGVEGLKEQLETSKRTQSDEDEGFEKLKQALGEAETRQKNTKEVYDIAVDRLKQIQDAYGRLTTAMGNKELGEEKIFKAEDLIHHASEHIQKQKEELENLRSKQTNEQQQINELKEQIAQYKSVQTEVSNGYTDVITSYEGKYKELMSQFENIIKSSPMPMMTSSTMTTFDNLSRNEMQGEISKENTRENIPENIPETEESKRENIIGEEGTNEITATQ